MKQHRAGSIRHFAGRHLLFCLLACFTTAPLLAQHPLKLSFVFRNNGQDLLLNQVVSDLSGTKYKASDIAMYISDLKITHDGGQLLDFGDSVFYVNIRASIFDLGMQPVNSVEAIAFSVGVPEHLNHTDISAYPEDHPLYFKTPAMHWGWTAGYTFLLIDGMADSDNDQEPDASFELHCLGDANFQQVQLANKATTWEDGTREIFQYVNLDQWLRGIGLATLDIQHGSTGVNATAMSNVAHYPVFTAPPTASVENIDAPSGTMRFHSEGNALTVSWESMPGVGRLEVCDMSGKLLHKIPASEPQGIRAFPGIAPGAYLVRAISAGGAVLHTLKAVQP